MLYGWDKVCPYNYCECATDQNVLFLVLFGGMVGQSVRTGDGEMDLDKVCLKKHNL